MTVTASKSSFIFIPGDFNHYRNSPSRTLYFMSFSCSPSIILSWPQPLPHYTLSLPKSTIPRSQFWAPHSQINPVIFPAHSFQSHYTNNFKLPRYTQTPWLYYLFTVPHPIHVHTLLLTWLKLHGGSLQSLLCLKTQLFCPSLSLSCSLDKNPKPG